jgi:hypothetical protein
MKNIATLSMLMLLSVLCFGKRTYTLSKEQFVSQFTNAPVMKSNPLSTITGQQKTMDVRCTSEKGQDVVLYTNELTLLKVTAKGDKKYDFFLNAVTCSNDTITGSETTIWNTRKKPVSLLVADVESFIIEAKYQEMESPYYNRDSCCQLVKHLNDSLEAMYATGTETIMEWHPKQKENAEPWVVREGVCYDMLFKDDVKVYSGVVQKLTHDSIYISNGLNAAMARDKGEDHRTYGYPINSIASIKLAPRGGYGIRTLNVEDFDIRFKEMEKKELGSPTWFSFERRRGHVHFYRSLLTEDGFKGITEIDGKAIWYEGI